MLEKSEHLFLNYRINFNALITTSKKVTKTASASASASYGKFNFFTKTFV